MNELTNLRPLATVIDKAKAIDKTSEISRFSGRIYFSSSSTFKGISREKSLQVVAELGKIRIFLPPTWMIGLWTRFSVAVWSICHRFHQKLCESSPARRLQVRSLKSTHKLFFLVKIYSGIPKDTTMERNTLMAKCYPRLKDYCREKHGLEFQVSSSLIRNFPI
jgi:hypothetical protein